MNIFGSWTTGLRKRFKKVTLDEIAIRKYLADLVLMKITLGPIINNPSLRHNERRMKNPLVVVLVDAELRKIKIYCK